MAMYLNTHADDIVHVLVTNPHPPTSYSRKSVEPVAGDDRLHGAGCATLLLQKEGLRKLNASFESSSLWSRTLAPQNKDDHEYARASLRNAYLQFRQVVSPLAAQIAIAMPMFTDHSIDHIDSLWDTASLVCGATYPINPAEAFVLGGAFLLHDLGMGLAAFPGGIRTIETDPLYPDLLQRRIEERRSQRASADDQTEISARDQVVAELLRARHSAQAKRLVTERFRASDGSEFYLLENTNLRQQFGVMIGEIAASHWWNVADLKALEQPQGSCTDHPSDWEVDPLKVACILRLADAAHIDHRRAPTYLHAFRKPTGEAADHWRFQERLTRPRVNRDRFEFTATQPFGRAESGAWWLAYETIRVIDNELRRVDALCADLERPRFAVRSVAGADSPARLSAFIRTEGWKPIDASLRVSDVKNVIASLGGQDLYGERPWIALRELIANASDATCAVQAYEGVDHRKATVVVRLTQEDDGWWLSVEDDGIGMDPSTMVSALADFGKSQWKAVERLEQFPGILARGFSPTGRFGIGFFAVFMIADRVLVRSLSYDEAPRSTHILEFENGVASRPLLRVADPTERLRMHGTTVLARLLYDPCSPDGLFKGTNRNRRDATTLLHATVSRVCALADVDIAVEGPNDRGGPTTLIRGEDWLTIPAEELFRRIYCRETADHFERLIYDGYEKIFTLNETRMLGDAGETIGRGILANGWENVGPDLQWRSLPEAPVYVGGFESGLLRYSMGAFAGRPLTANRLNAFPNASPPAIIRWIEEQAASISANLTTREDERFIAAYFARGMGATAPTLPVAICSSGQLDQSALGDWSGHRDTIFLVSYLGLMDFYPESGDPIILHNPTGVKVDLPDNALAVLFHSPWFFPAEILAKPRDEEFANCVDTGSRWDLGSWWCESGNFGSAGLAIKTIATTWHVSVGELVRTMKPLHLSSESDDRIILPTADGQSVHIEAIELVRTRPAAHNEL
jgi:Histidine kinase-, DNA gyrase B-, and HSP90-like ATPase